MHTGFTYAGFPPTLTSVAYIGRTYEYLWMDLYEAQHSKAIKLPSLQCNALDVSIVGNPALVLQRLSLVRASLKSQRSKPAESRARVRALVDRARSDEHSNTNTGVVRRFKTKTQGRRLGCIAPCSRRARGAARAGAGARAGARAGAYRRAAAAAPARRPAAGTIRSASASAPAAARAPGDARHR